MPFGMRVGSDLKAARKKAGISVDAIAKRTKVSVSRLVALEKGDFKNLPAGFYLFSLVRAYAGEVQLDPEPIVEQLRAEFAEKDALDALHALEATGTLPSKKLANAGESTDQRSSLYKTVAVAIGLFLIATAGTGAYLYGRQGTLPEEIRGTTVETALVPLPAPPPATTNAPPIEAPPQAASMVQTPASTKSHRPNPRTAARKAASKETVADNSDVSDAAIPSPERTEESADRPANVEEFTPAR